MSIIEALLLGGLQGLTEFIPVSSSGHLVLAEHLFGLKVSSEFDSLVNLGTVLALMFYFRLKISSILIGIFKDKKVALARNLIISFIPVAVVGFMFADFFNSELIQNPWTVIMTLSGLGLIMILIERLPKLFNKQGMDNLSKGRALFIGLAQILALIPGTSRSGATMVAGRIAGMSYKDAAEYSFLLSIPVMTGVLMYAITSEEGKQFIIQETGAFLASNVAGFATGLFAVGYMIKFLQKGNLAVFGYYRIILAALIATILIIS